MYIAMYIIHYYINIESVGIHSYYQEQRTHKVLSYFLEYLRSLTKHSINTFDETLTPLMKH